MNDDELLKRLAALITDAESKPAAINKEREDLVLAVEKIINEIVDGEDIVVEAKLHEPLPSMGYVSIIGKEIRFSNKDLFVEVFNLAPSIDIYPRLDHLVQIDFTFHGLTK